MLVRVRLVKKSSLFLVLIFLVASAEASQANNLEIILQPSDLIRRGNDNLKAGHIDDARLEYNRALKTNLTKPQQANAYNGLCIADIREELWEDAIKNCDKALELVPYNWRYYNNLGNVYLGLGDYEKAMQEYEKGLRFAPQSTTIRKNMALTQSRAGTDVTAQNDN